MSLRVLLPHAALFEGEATKVVAEGVDGRRGFLPRHIDFILPLRYGILSATLVGGDERYFAVKGGSLLKQGQLVTVATEEAVMASELEALPDDVLRSFAQQDEYERSVQKTMAQLEARFLKELIEMKGKFR